jgi:hypothetical protein
MLKRWRSSVQRFVHGAYACWSGCIMVAFRPDTFHTGKDPSRVNMAKASATSWLANARGPLTARPTMQAPSRASAQGAEVSIANITPDRSGLSSSGSAPILRQRQCHRTHVSGRSG